ncbi:hypothetical protein E4K10_43035 [Streptomyces sp. T1317-0309]|nr:hypothetical protein E4K10_43035 [Streptomyces sp. T1317-0309]
MGPVGIVDRQRTIHLDRITSDAASDVMRVDKAMACLSAYHIRRSDAEVPQSGSSWCCLHPRQCGAVRCRRGRRRSVDGELDPGALQHRAPGEGHRHVLRHHHRRCRRVPGIPDSPYAKDLAKIDAAAKSYIDKAAREDHRRGKKPAVVFDIDDTLLLSSTTRSATTTPTTRPLERLRGPRRPPARVRNPELVRYAASKGVEVFYNSGLSETQRAARWRT